MTKLNIHLIFSIISFSIIQLFYGIINTPCNAAVPVSGSGHNRIDGTTGTPLGGVGYWCSKVTVHGQAC